jgi:hypothetical protein
MPGSRAITRPARPESAPRGGFATLRTCPEWGTVRGMASSAGQSGSLGRGAQWRLVLALFVGAAAFALFGVLTVLAPYLAAVGAVWGSVLLATHPWVLRRIPNVRGAIVLTGVVIAVGLTLYATQAGHHFKRTAEAREATMPPPAQAQPAAPEPPHPDSGSY